MRASGAVFECCITSDYPGMVVLRVSGAGAMQLFANESGGHRFQRNPPTETSDRVHSSTITVAVFDAAQARRLDIPDSEIRLETTKGHGPGGQNRNKVETAVRAVHLPTGITVFQQTERSQGENKRIALKELKRRVLEHIQGAQQSAERDDRRAQVGTGQRGDKVRTVQVQNGRVTNHLNGRKMDLKAYLKGEIWKLQ